MVQVIDRPILESLRGSAAVGIYQANYRLGIFMMLIVSMYDFAWRPFFLSHAADTDAKQLFARILTYFILFATGIFLFLSFFLADFVQLPIFAGHPLVAAPYWGGLTIVPVILLAYLFLGVYNNLVAGIYIEKKTGYLPLITFAAAFINVVANYLLIPVLGLMGAALATLASYFVMMSFLYVVVQKIYPVEYEMARIGKIALAAAIVFGLFQFVPAGSLSVVLKAGLLLLFAALMYWMRFFVPSELGGIAGMVKSRRGKTEVGTRGQGPGTGGREA
jgi:O-antigen/teichoic acid export membrane protein